LTLKWNGFEDLEPKFLRTSKRISLQEVRPSSEKDLVIGDHVIFWNHRAYDLINQEVHEAWRLENAVLVDKRPGGEDTFLGHGSGEQTNLGMRRKLMDRFNGVAGIAQHVIDQTESTNPHTRTKAFTEMKVKFPHIEKVGTEWRIRGYNFKHFDEKLHRITTPKDPELIGLRDPVDPAKMNRVKRPIESE
jgi:hypothetical protein